MGRSEKAYMIFPIKYKGYTTGPLDKNPSKLIIWLNYPLTGR